MPAKATQSPRSAVTPSVHRPNHPARSPDREATGVRVTYEAALATISTGDRRGAPLPPGSARIQMGRDTASVWCMRSPPVTPADSGREMNKHRQIGSTAVNARMYRPGRLRG